MLLDFATYNSPVAVTRLLPSALAALSEVRVSEVVEHFHFDDCFTCKNQARTLELTDKLRLPEFFRKARQLFPYSALEIISLLETGDQPLLKGSMPRPRPRLQASNEIACRPLESGL